MTQFKTKHNNTICFSTNGNTQCPQASLPNHLTVYEHNVDAKFSNFSSKTRFNIECYFGKVFYKNERLNNSPGNYPQVSHRSFADIIEVCKCIKYQPKILILTTIALLLNAVVKGLLGCHPRS